MWMWWCPSQASLWWSFIDVVLLVVSFFAVFWAAKNTSKHWMKISLYSSWSLLALIILNEQLHVIHLTEYLIYIPAVALIGLHLYNRKYCQCAGDHCCAA